MRIIAGKNCGRKLIECSKFKDLRPTTDSNRENLFNILSSSRTLKDTGFELEKSDLLDVFSGSGAISFEALSRGAKSATLIEKVSDHLDISKKNASLLKEENIQFFRADITKPIFPSSKQFNLIYIDPPYSKDMIVTALDNLTKSSWIKTGALIIIEHSFLEKIKLEESMFTLLDERKYGKTIFSFYLAV